MPIIKDFQSKQKDFKPIKHTPWDTSPGNNNDAPLSPKMVSPSTNKNPVQTRFKPSSKPPQNQDKLESNPVQVALEHGSKPESKTGCPPTLHQEITDSSGPGEKGENLEEIILSLTGAQKKIFLYMVDLCNQSKSSNFVNIYTTELSKMLSIPRETIRTSLRRLTEKRLIKRLKFKQGLGGFVCFEIDEQAKYCCLEAQKNELLQMVKTGSQTSSQTGLLSDVVSSSYLNTTTTNTLSGELEQIDCTPLSEVGFNRSHLIQVHREHQKKPENSLPVEIIQDSINALAYDIKHNNIAERFNSSPAVVLTALLKKGMPYSSKTPEKVLSPKEEAMQAYLLCKEKKIQQSTEIEQRAKEVALTEWINNLQEEELLQFNPDKIDDQQTGIGARFAKIGFRKKAVTNAKEYFEEVVWPDEKKKIIEN